METTDRKSALITGATKGIGLAIARMLASEGYHLFITARHNEDLRRLKDSLEQAYAGIKVHYAVCDCLDSGQVSALAASVHAAFSTLHILVNNTGIYREATLLEESATDLADQLQVNLLTAHYLCKYFGRIMREARKGHIFNISSIASRQPVLAAGAYTVTKYALAGLTMVLRKELAPFGVKVTEIIPGPTLTSSWDETAVQEDQFVAATDIAETVRTCLKMSKGANVDEIIIRPLAGS